MSINYCLKRARPAEEDASAMPVAARKVGRLGAVTLEVRAAALTKNGEAIQGLFDRLSQEDVVSEETFRTLCLLEQPLSMPQRLDCYLYQGQIIAEKDEVDEFIKMNALQGVDLYLTQDDLDERQRLIALEIAYLLASDNPEKALLYAKQGAGLAASPEKFWAGRVKREDLRDIQKRHGEKVSTFEVVSEYAESMKALHCALSQPLSTHYIVLASELIDDNQALAEKYLSLIDHETLSVDNKIYYHKTCTYYYKRIGNEEEASLHAGKVIAACGVFGPAEIRESIQLRDDLVTAYMLLMSCYVAQKEFAKCRDIYNQYDALTKVTGPLVLTPEHRIMISTYIGGALIELGEKPVGMLHLLSVFFAAPGEDIELKRITAKLIFQHKEIAYALNDVHFINFCLGEGTEESLTFVIAHQLAQK